MRRRVVIPSGRSPRSHLIDRCLLSFRSEEIYFRGVAPRREITKNRLLHCGAALVVISGSALVCIVFGTPFVWVDVLLYSREEIRFGFCIWYRIIWLFSTTIAGMGISAYLGRTAYIYRSQMLYYAADIGQFGERAEGAKRIGRLSFWLLVSAVSFWCYVASGLFVVYMWMPNQELEAVALFFAYSAFAFSRIITSLATVNATHCLTLPLCSTS